MPRTFRLLPAVALAAAGALLGACSRPDAAAVDAALQRDLEQVTETGIELAPRGSGRDVISAAELGRTPPPRTPGPRVRPAAAPPVVAPAQDGGGAAVSAKPAPDAPAAAPGADTAGGPAGRRPVPVTPTRKGPYRSVEEVIRDAPFPIKP